MIWLHLMGACAQATNDLLICKFVKLQALRWRHIHYLSVFPVAGNPFELTMGREPRKIKLNGRDCLIQADKENREILIDGTCYYRVGEPVRNVYIAGMKHTIYYQGPYVNIWIDSIQVGCCLKASYYSLVQIVFVVVLLTCKAFGWESDLVLLRDND